MAYALIVNGAAVKYPYSVSEFRIDNPLVSLPLAPTVEQLLEVGLVKVEAAVQPSASLDKLVVEGAPIYVNGSWYQSWEIVQASDDVILQREAALKQQNKEQAMQLLVESDWVEIPSVTNTNSPLHLANGTEWAEYRNLLRQIAVRPPAEAVTWPIKPEEVWVEA